MTELSLLEICAVAYLMLVFIKTMLCYAVLDSAEIVFNRKYGSRLRFARVVVMVLCTPVIVFFMVPSLLLSEKFSFFVVYSKFKIMRDVASAL